MTEDDAFIRAVVDGRGDDTPRLVYADWLDDRDDPRGAYLRAEHGWAATHDPGDRQELARLAKALDPVWVARVSRPPVGVCCDHLRFTSPVPPPAASDLDALQTRLKLTLPLELRALLLNYNGGKPTPDAYLARWRKPDDLPDHITRFFCVIPIPADPQTPPKKLNESLTLEYTTTVLNNGMVAKSTDATAYEKWAKGVRDFVTFAEPSGLGVLAIGLTARRAGKVYEINRSVLATASSPRLLADSLPEFLATITAPAKR